tara:strand:+ start:523 stop:732 length:210 start_codon:yes stop_codon:yes gene_type:complete
MKWTEIDGRRDCENGIPFKTGKGKLYEMGYGKLADEGRELPDNAPEDVKRGYSSREELNRLRAMLLAAS